MLNVGSKQDVDVGGGEKRRPSGLPPIQCTIVLGGKAVNTEDHTTICDGVEPAYRRYKARYAHTERERGTKNISIFMRMQHLQIRTTTTF